MDGTSKWTVPRADVPGLLVSATDSKYIIFFVVRRSMRQPGEDDVDDKDLRDLLETQAAAKMILAGMSKSSLPMREMMIALKTYPRKT